MKLPAIGRSIVPAALVLLALLMVSPAGALPAGTLAGPPSASIPASTAPRAGHTLAAPPCPARLVLVNACPGPSTVTSGAGIASSGGQTPRASGPYWKEICAACGPGAREDVMMAYDASDGYTVLFGGYESGTIMGDTWTYTNGNWTQIFPTTSPPARFDGIMEYDVADGYVLLFGGVADSACSTAFGDTWEFHAGQWTELFPTTSPSPRFFPALAWDGADNSMVLFGGVDCSNTYYGDTWQFAGGQWTALTPATSPSPRFATGFTWDATDNYDLLFGGDAGGTMMADTWSFSGGNWTALTPASAPSARGLQDHQMVTDGGSPLLWGGYSFATGSCFADTWKFTAGSWTEVFPTTSPPAKGWGTMTNDPTAGTIDYGGYECGVSDLADTWVYVSGPTLSTPIATPSAPESGQSVTFNSTLVFAGQTPDTFWWTWSPAPWMQCAPSTSLFLNCTPLRTGNYSITVHAQDASGLKGSATLSRWYVSRGPIVSVPTSNVSRLDVGQSAKFTTTLIYPGSGGDVYSWSASGAGMGCPASTLTHVVCVPTAPGLYNVTARVTDSNGGAGWNTSRYVNVSPLPAEGIPLASPALSVDVGEWANFTANVTNMGAGGDQYLWSASPVSGLLCQVSLSPRESCLATAAGSYNVTLTLTDTNGGVGWGYLGYQVYAVPTLSAPSPSLKSVDVGQSVVFSPVVETSGSGGLGYNWSSSAVGFGCGSNGLATYVCTPSAPGSYTISVVGADSNGGVGRAVSLPYTVFALPAVATPLGSVASPATNESVTFTAALLNAGSGGDLYTWASSGPSLVCGTSHGPSDSCTASATGTYTVTLTVKDSNGGVGRATSATFTVTAPLQATASATPTSGRSALTVTFSSSAWGGTAPYRYAWVFGDGPAGTSSDPNPTHIYTSQGSYTARLWVNDSSGNSVVVTVAVSVSAPQSPSSFSAIPGGGLTIGLFLLLAVVVVLTLVVLMRRGRHPDPSPGGVASPSSPDTP